MEKPVGEIMDAGVVYHPIQPVSRCFNLACSNRASEGGFGVVIVQRSEELLKGLVLVGCGPCCLALSARLRK